MRVVPSLIPAAALLLMLSGCRVNETRDGEKKDVKIDTPFGNMQVKTNDSSVQSQIGLPIYPGATEVKKHDNDDGAADVNMSFGSFQMRVKAATYRTSDPPDKVEAFYRNALKQYGDVIACQGDRAVGSPSQTTEGLACDDKKNHHVVIQSNNGHNGHKLDLKAGSRQHQHDVGIDPDGSGTKIGLVALDLPGKLFSDDDSGGDRD